MQNADTAERLETIVIGGGQAGLSVGYHLARRGRPFVILEANQRVGDSWRKRWDSLRLFTPARYDSLVGMPFPARPTAFPTKDEMAEYLERYVERFRLPVRTGVAVDGLSRVGDRYVVTAGGRRFEADHVVVAMANYQTPRVPSFAAERCWSSAPAIRARRSPSRWRGRGTPRGCRAGTPARSRSASRDWRAGTCSRVSCCGSCFIACSR
jgi:putative flavoprotein involved in K+ transport